MLIPAYYQDFHQGIIRGLVTKLDHGTRPKVKWNFKRQPFDSYIMPNFEREGEAAEYKSLNLKSITQLLVFLTVQFWEYYPVAQHVSPIRVGR